MADDHSDLIEPISIFQRDTAHRIGKWKFGKQSKMRLRCMIAASHEQDPSLALSYFLESSDCVVKFDHPAFNKVAAFIKDFMEKVGS